VEPVVLWGMLAMAAFVHVQPFWASAIPPFDDVGGHLAMADAWARLEEVGLYQEIYARRTGLVPNSVFARFASILYPAISPMVAMRMFLSLVVLSTIGSLYACARTFDRSPWLIFLALPFFWNGSTYHGMVNYIPTFPLMFGGVALAAKTGETGRWYWGAGLGALAIFSFFVHGMGVLFVCGASAFILVLSCRRGRHLGWLAAFVVPAALWVRWRSNVSGRGAPSDGMYELLTQHGRWFEPARTLEYIVRRGFDIVQAPQDLWCFVVLMTVWIAYMGLSEGPVWSDRGEPASDGAAWRRLATAVWEQAYRRRLLLMTLCLWAALIVFPAYIKMTDIKMRLIGPFFMSAALVPRLPRRDVVVVAVTGVSFVACMWFGEFVTAKTRAFQRKELEPLTELIDEIPEQSRAQCIRVYREGDWIFRFRPLGHNCAGLLHVRRSSYGGFHFPGTGFNPIKFIGGEDFDSVGRGKWRQLGRLQSWDYVIERGSHQTFDPRVATRIATAGGGAVGEEAVTEWSLYRVNTFDDVSSESECFGGPGGHTFRWRCPEGEGLAGLNGRLRSNKMLGSLRPKCRSLGPDKANDTHSGPDIGSAGGGGYYSVSCSSKAMMVGLAGASGQYVDRLDLLCAQSADRKTNETRIWGPSDVQVVEGGGGEGGDSFRWRCPTDEVAVGVKGRHGHWIDAVGLLCDTPHSPDVLQPSDSNVEDETSE
jgi:hypothetical protein